ncbi:Hypothetical predicted protein [Olea europaea subsp. europaea]|uniref:Rubber elongation factor n=2 Tax=Olea europaea subsp. europaea TaxID=158383 RepID=A0A8S0SLC1_OLEEU|nr:Hypothetical predicted protein [Olea europaea subsp. europaea]
MAETNPKSQPEVVRIRPLPIFHFLFICWQFYDLYRGSVLDDFSDKMDETKEQRMKRLEFVQVAAFDAVSFAAKVYNYTKDKSGPLKPGIQTVEGTVKTVVGPVYDRYHGVPVEFLKFVDRKVDESMNMVQSHVPAVLKQVSTQAFSTAQKAPVAARSVMTVAEHLAVSTWCSLNRLPLFPQVAKVVVPTASYYTEKYNQSVQLSAENGYKVASYLPLVPTEKIAKAFSVDKTEPVVLTGGAVEAN